MSCYGGSYADRCSGGGCSNFYDYSCCAALVAVIMAVVIDDEMVDWLLWWFLQ
jgi:hypothetical protein